MEEKTHIRLSPLVYKKLDKFKDKQGLKTFSDTINLLLKVYELTQKNPS